MLETIAVVVTIKLVIFGRLQSVNMLELNPTMQKDFVEPVTSKFIIN